MMKHPIRVLIWMVAIDRIPGGHRVQIEQTCRHLNVLGVETVLSYDEEPDLTGYDLVHGFNLSASNIRLCRRRQLPVVLSTIYWNRAYITGQHIQKLDWKRWIGRSRVGLALLRSALIGKHIEKCEAFVERLQTLRIIYEMADMLLPNSELEAAAIQAELNVTTPYHLVPNAVDPTSFTLNGAPDWKARDHILYAGRFEPHKNQLGFIEAMRNTDLPVLLVGPPHPHHPNYYEQCKQRATKNISLLPGVPHEDLAKFYQKARVHVLPSWFETTGLVSLEAALCGCNIVTTNRGYAKEYFQDMAWYCDPADPASILNAIRLAFNAPCRTELRSHILKRYTWEHTAKATLEAYCKILFTQYVNVS